MTGAELVQLTGAELVQKRLFSRIAVTPAYTAWAKSHQALLKRAVSEPDVDIDMVECESPARLRELQASQLWNEKLQKKCWTGPNGDEDLFRLVMMDPDLADAEVAIREAHAVHTLQMMNNKTGDVKGGLCSQKYFTEAAPETAACPQPYFLEIDK